MCTYITSLNIHMYVHADIGKPLGKYSTIFAPVRRPKYVHMQLLNFGEKSKKKSPFAPSRFSIFPSVTYKSSAWNCHVFWSEASLDTPRFTDGFFMLLSKSREHRTFFVPFLFLITFRLHVCIKHAIRWSKRRRVAKKRDVLTERLSASDWDLARLPHIVLGRAFTFFLSAHALSAFFSLLNWAPKMIVPAALSRGGQFLIFISEALVCIWKCVHTSADVDFHCNRPSSIANWISSGRRLGGRLTQKRW